MMNYNFLFEEFLVMDSTAHSFADVYNSATNLTTADLFNFAIMFFPLSILFLILNKMIMVPLALEFGKAILKSKEIVEKYTRRNSISSENGKLVSIKYEMVDFHFQCEECVVFVERSHGTGYVEKTWKIPYEECEFIENEKGIFEVEVLTDIKKYKLIYLYSLFCGLFRAYKTEEEVKESIPHYIINMPKGYSIEDMRLPVFLK